MPKKGKRKTRITKAEVRKIQEERKKKIKGRKNKIIPGPWTEIDPEFKVKAEIKWGENFLGKKLRGAFREDEMWAEKSWYPIIINITSKDIKSKVKKYGLDNYLAACEKSLNDSPKKLKDHGHIVLLTVGADGSQRDDPDRRFISCHAKTNRKTIMGFSALRTPKGGGKKKYMILGEDDDTRRD